MVKVIDNNKVYTYNGGVCLFAQFCASIELGVFNYTLEKSTKVSDKKRVYELINLHTLENEIVTIEII